MHLAARLLLLPLLAGPAIAAAQSPEVQTLYAQAQAAQAANHPDQAIQDYRRILALDPSIAPAYNNLGRLLFNLGRFAEAVPVLTKGLELAPDMHPAQIMLGASLFQLNQPEKALDPLQAGVAAMPADRFARVTLARTLIALSRPAEAIPQLEAVIAADGKDQEAWYLLGKLHLQLSQQALAQVQRINPASTLALELNGEIMESMQNTPGAIDAYKQAIASAPANPAPLQHLADLYFHTGDWQHARESFQALLAREPGNCFNHWKLGSTLDELTDSAYALTETNTALQQCPDLPQAHAERARLLLRQGQAAEALPDLQIAEKAAPDEASVQRLLAQTYRALGNKPAADAANQRFLALEQQARQQQEQKATRVLQSTTDPTKP